MAIAREYGKPDIFLTFTCNPRWDEITNELREDAQGNKLERASDRPGALLLLEFRCRGVYRRLMRSRISSKIEATDGLHHEASQRSSIGQAVLR
jgi:hypothetical protein